MAENGKLSVPVASMEDKLSLLEKRFSELEEKYFTLQAALVTEKKTEPKEPLSEEKKAEEAKPGDEKSSKTEDNSTPKSRVRIVTSRIDTETKERKDFESEQILDSTTRRDYALLLRKIVEEENEENDGDIEIYDDALIKLMRELLRHYPGHLFEGNPVTIRSPYEPLIQNWDMLLAESKKETPEKDRARSDLRELLQTIVKGSGDAKLDSYMQVRDSLKKQGSTTFDALWTIFPPGTVVYGHLFLKTDQIFIVEDNLRPWPREDNNSRSGTPNIWELKCWTYDFTGKVFLRKAVKLPFEQFQGTKPISSLPFYPMEAMPRDKRETTEAKLLKSGKMFRKYCTAKEGEMMYKYKGQAIFDKKGLRDLQAKDPVMDFSRSLGALLLGRDRAGVIPPKPSPPSYPLNNVDVMVDFDSYYLHGSTTSQIGDTTVEEEITACRCPECSNNEVLVQRFKPHYDNMTGRGDENWEPLQTMLCPPRVLGYILQDKQWAQLAVDNLDVIPHEDVTTVMNSLHLGGEDDGQQEKNLLYQLVKNHGEGKAKKEGKGYELDDIVAEKGKGLVILLYGTPGVGKTSTAQMVAKAARKPLFPISVADVGTDAEFVESNFRRIFDLATTWRAILLIDEADVFLQSRTQGIGPSAERSALVSVFLRVLEYYRGILFLTTNQIAQFDIAVQSRVHIALKYEELTKKQTKDIFLEFLSQYNEKGVVKGYNKFDNYVGGELYRKKFDGRQIRNIITCAMGYARGREEKMSLDDVKHIVTYMEDFKNDLAGQMMKWQEQQKGTRMN